MNTRGRIDWALALLLTVGCAATPPEPAVSVEPSAPAEPVEPVEPLEPVAPEPRTLADVREGYVAELMRGLDDPDTIVDWDYVTAILEAWDGVKPEPWMRGYGNGNIVFADGEAEPIGSRLHAALPRKRGAALVPAVLSAHRLGYGTDAVFREAALRAWPNIDVNHREMLLRAAWDALRSPEVEPILRHLIASRPTRPTQWHVDDLPTLALWRLHDLDPDDARAMILADISRKKPLFGGVALTALPDDRLDEVEANFRRPLGEIAHWSFDMEKHGLLAERYGGPDSLAAGRALLDRPERIWDTRLLRVVMSQDREDAFRRMARALEARDPDPKNAYKHRLVLSRVLALNHIERPSYWDADAAEFVRGYVDDPDERVRRTAQVLLESAAR